MRGPTLTGSPLTLPQGPPACSLRDNSLQNIQNRHLNERREGWALALCSSGYTPIIWWLNLILSHSELCATWLSFIYSQHHKLYYKAYFKGKISSNSNHSCFMLVCLFGIPACKVSFEWSLLVKSKWLKKQKLWWLNMCFLPLQGLLLQLGTNGKSESLGQGGGWSQGSGLAPGRHSEEGAVLRGFRSNLEPHLWFKKIFRLE